MSDTEIYLFVIALSFLLVSIWAFAKRKGNSEEIKRLRRRAERNKVLLYKLFSHLGLEFYTEIHREELVIRKKRKRTGA